MSEDLERELFLYGKVEYSLIKDLVSAITKINNHDNAKQEELARYVRKPIKIHISTYGGYLYDGMALVDAMNSSKTPVYTIAEGMALSMGFIILVSGSKCYAFKNATVMYHEVCGGGYEFLESLKETVSELERLQDLTDTIILEKTNIPKKRLSEVRLSKTDWYMSAKEALKFKVVDELI